MPALFSWSENKQQFLSSDMIKGEILGVKCILISKETLSIQYLGYFYSKMDLKL
jgi:hypothetical protein